MLIEYIVIFIIAFVISIAITPLAKRLSFNLNLLDRPNQRKIHKKPIPLLGGAAIFIFFANSGRQIRARVKIWSHLLFSFFFLILALNSNFLNDLKMSTPGKDHSHHRIHLIILGAIALTFINASLQQFPACPPPAGKPAGRLAMLSIVLVLVIFFWNFLTQVKVYERKEG